MIKSEYELVRILKDEFKTLSEFEALQIACKIRQNEILVAAFEVSLSDKSPPALAAVALALGYKTDSNYSIKDSLDNIAELLREKDE